MMDRRQFLKWTAQVLAIASLPATPAKAEEKHPDFDSNIACWDFVTVTDVCNWNYPNLDPVLREAKKVLTEQIQAFVPRKYRTPKYIKWIYHTPGSCGGGFLDDPSSWRGTVCWKYCPQGGKVA